MSRKLRIEYPGATHPIMNRGDQHEYIFRTSVLTIDTSGPYWHSGSAQFR
jgi:hypothetical protein